MAHLRGLKPLPELLTQRLSLRLARPSMAPAVLAFYAENWDGHLAPWSPPAPPDCFTEGFWRKNLERAALEWEMGSAARFVLQPRGPQTGTVLGTCNLTNIVRGPFQACHLGYQIGRAHQGQGLMREAVESIVGFAFGEMRLHRIMANYIPGNERSARLLASLDFQQEGLAKDYLFIDGAWRDHVLTSRTNPQPQDPPPAG